MHLFSYEENLKLFEGNKSALLKEALHGLEKENLRISENKLLSDKQHPKSLGSALTHPNITLDFSEAQLEIVTKTFPTIEEALKDLEHLYQYVYQSIDSEMLWPHSNPCAELDENKIPLAYFGMTQKGYEKWLYRKGLSYRCGKKMQLLSGIHYNFSFSKLFWNRLFESLKTTLTLKEFISENYFSLIRNFLRMGWLSSYLFGASPICDRSFFNQIEKPIMPFHHDSLYLPEGTSIRMSQLGYFSKIQNQLSISFNSLKEYLDDMNFALQTPHPFYQKIGLMKNGEYIQINENFLQIEAEHYSRIRPKAHAQIKRRPIEALKEGIGYFEVRNIDINPFSPIGIDKELLYFKHLFFIYCLFKESPYLSKESAKIVCENQNKVALFGRKPNLQLLCDISLKEISLKEWATQILNEMKPISELLDSKDKKYSKALLEQIKKVEDVNLTPSAQQLNLLIGKKQEFKDFVAEKAEIYKEILCQKKLSEHMKNQMIKRSEISLKELEKKEDESEGLLFGYEDMEPSTQMVLRESFNRRLKVEILDRKENIIRLSSSNKVHLIKQATQTSLDTFISFLAMENKRLTQILLVEKGLSAFSGDLYLNADQAIKNYSYYQNKKIVVKPNRANYGDGISFIDPNQKEEYKKAVMQVESMRDQILIEPFFSGDEYRFLVIGKKVVAICKRVPANVLGDGENTIEALIEIKNKKNEYRRHFQKLLKITSSEEKTLKDYGLTPQDIPKKNERVFLRYNSNVSTGGESHDMTDDVLGAYKEIALKATEALGATICGVDMIIQDIKKKPTVKNHLIIELNHNPALFIHLFPAVGKKRHVEKDLLDFLFD